MARMPVNRGASAQTMAETIMGDGVQITGASYSGAGRASGVFSNADQQAPGFAPSDRGVILSTGSARNVTNSNGQNNSSNRTTDNNTNDGLSDFDALAGTSTYDAAYIDIDFVADPGVTMLSMQFVFSSEEFPEYADSIYNDVVGVWVNGSPVVLEIGTGATSVGNLDENDNQNLYVDNTGDAFNSEMDGFTLTMTLKIPVVPGEPTSLRIGIADVSDSAYDSNLLIAADSIQGSVIAQSDSVTMQEGTTKTVDVLANDIDNSGGTLTITEINGVQVFAGSTVDLATGQSVTLNSDGTLSIVTDTDNDSINFNYEVTSSNGQTDVAYVTVDTIPCFVVGTMITTPSGDVPIESLAPGDLVTVRDRAPQPLRWIGRRIVGATGHHAPIRIAANTFGIHGELMVSPQHRILVRDHLAELWFGEEEVLIAAKDLVNGSTVRAIEGGQVEYVHILFDRHEVVLSAGLATESFLPGPQTFKAFEEEVQAEICALFPELEPTTGAGYSPAARPMLKAHEARVLLERRAA